MSDLTDLAGQRVQAKRFGSQPLAEWAPYDVDVYDPTDYPSDDLVGVLTLHNVPAWVVEGHVVLAAYTQYRVDGQFADPATIRRV